MRILLNFFVCLFFAFSSPCFAGIIYQDFEDNNGTPHRDNYESLPVEYGWGFNGAVVQRSKLGGTAPVHSGSYSWSATIPEGPKIQAGSAVVSRLQTYHMNLIQQCHDRLSFWVWADPSHVGDDTIMVKFFDQGLYKERGIGIWTKENQPLLM